MQVGRNRVKPHIMHHEARTACIVTVEDNPADVFLIGMVLKDQGVPFKLIHLTDGEHAIRALSAMDAPDLILLDLSLPLINGFEVLKKLRKQEHLAQVPIAILSSSESQRDRWHAERSGATRYVVKMTTLEAFRSEVGNAILAMLQRSGLRNSETKYTN